MTLTQTRGSSIAFDPRDSAFLEDPYPFYAGLRESDPLHLSPNGDVWLTRYADVQFVLTDRRFGKSAPAYSARASALGGEPVPPSMLFQNPPDHTRLRGLVTRAFTPRTIERLRPRIQSMADDLLDAAGCQFDLVERFAFPLPAMVIAELLGVPVEDQQRFHTWTSDVASAVDSTAGVDARTRGASAREQMANYFADLVTDRSKHPRGDLISELVSVQAAGDRLSLGELLSMCALLLAAGHETTVNLIANGAFTLARYPAAWTRLRNEPAHLSRAVEELLRYESPVQLTDRVALQDVQIDDYPIRTGQRIIVSMGAANHDPDVFEEPERLDLGRDPNPHLAFGHGIHFCLGPALARLEGELALSALLARFSIMEVAGPVVRGSTPMFRSLRSLPVRCQS